MRMSMDSCEALAAAGALLGPARSANPAAWFDGASMPRLWLNASAGVQKHTRRPDRACTVQCHNRGVSSRAGGICE